MNVSKSYEVAVLGLLQQILDELKDIKTQSTTNNVTYTIKNEVSSENFLNQLNNHIITNKN